MPDIGYFSDIRSIPSKNKRKHLARKKWNYMEDGEDRVSLIEDVEITNGKADTIYSALSNETEKCAVQN